MAIIIEDSKNSKHPKLLFLKSDDGTYNKEDIENCTILVTELVNDIITGDKFLNVINISLTEEQRSAVNRLRKELYDQIKTSLELKVVTDGMYLPDPKYFKDAVNNVINASPEEKSKRNRKLCAEFIDAMQNSIDLNKGVKNIKQINRSFRR